VGKTLQSEHEEYALNAATHKSDSRTPRSFGGDAVEGNRETV
jgi:hypothetical protein